MAPGASSSAMLPNLFLNCLYRAGTLKSRLGLRSGVAPCRRMRCLCGTEEQGCVNAMPRAEGEPSCCFSGCLVLVLVAGVGGKPSQRFPVLQQQRQLCRQTKETARVGCLESAGSFGERSHAVPAWQAPVRGIRAVVGFGFCFSWSSLCRLSERREGCAALGWRVLPPPVRDGPVRCVPAHPWLWCGQRRLHLPGFRTTYARCGVRGGLVWFGLVFLEGRKKGGEKGG